MFPIPDPSRLFPPRLNKPTVEAGSDTLAGAILGVGSIIPIYGLAIWAGIIAYDWAHWAAIPAGVVAFGIAAALMSTHPLVCGATEGVFYGYVAFLFSGGRDYAQPTGQLIFSGLVVLVFLVLGIISWRKDSWE